MLLLNIITRLAGNQTGCAGKSLNLPVVQESRLTLEQSFEHLASGSTGLRESEALRRLEEYGSNEVARERVPHPAMQLLKAFNNPFIYVLLALSCISFYTDFVLPFRDGEKTDLTGTVIVLAMVCVSAFMRFIQEYRSSKAAEALKAMVRTTATVSRVEEGQVRLREVNMAELVPGDIVKLSAGDMVPADVRLLESRDLFISQAALTGESIPVEKYDTMAEVCGKAALPCGASATKSVTSENELLELPNVCFMGTNVVSGTATALVVGTGAKTYFGSLAKAVAGSRSQTAFDKGVNSVSWLLIRFMLVMVPVVFVINGLSKGDWGEAFLFALAVAVGLTPEMLPMIVSANLAKGAVGMARQKVVVKRLNAIQNFGAMDVLCTDKTGTLTQDNIILERHVDNEGRRCNRILELAWLNSSFQTGMKNLMDRAVVRFAQENPTLELPGTYRKVDELPFDFMRRRLTVVLENDNAEHLVVCKGAVEETLAVCTRVRRNGKAVAMTEKERRRLMDLSRVYNEDGFRVLAVATAILGAEQKRAQYGAEVESDLLLEGFLTFLDPPKETAGPALKALCRHGVSVKVLTGDTPVVTAKICREVGLEPGEALLGRALDAMSDGQLAAEVEKRVVFAKLTPLQKSRVIKALRHNGHTVGFLGDGINDAPALRDADVGISVDTGSDIAKESADIILLEKSLMVLEEGVLKGRETFGNIMKYLNMTASSNFGNVFSVLVASAFIPFLPMLPIHLLIQNLLYDISQLSLPWDHMDREFLQKPRKWDAGNIGRFMVWIGPTSSIFDISTFALMWFVFGANVPEMQALFHSGWFVEGLLSQTLVVHMLRTRKIPFVQSTAALPVLMMTGLVIIAGISLPFTALGAKVGLEPLPLSYFPWLLGTLGCYCLVAQGMKTLYMKKFGRWY